MLLDGGCDDDLSQLRRFGEQRMHGGTEIFPQELTETIEIEKNWFSPFSLFPPVNFLSAGRTVLTGDNGGNRGLKHFPSPFSLFPPVDFLSAGRTVLTGDNGGNRGLKHF